MKLIFSFENVVFVLSAIRLQLTSQRLIPQNIPLLLILLAASPLASAQSINPDQNTNGECIAPSDANLVANAPVDTDGDGIIDALDFDSDGDGISDIVEAAGAPGNADTDGDGIADRLDIDSDNDGILDSVESKNTNGGLDTDNDGLPNYLDLDSDNDNVFDLVEAGFVDDNNDGVVDGALDENGYAVNPVLAQQSRLTLTDSDGDGILDRVEGKTDDDGDGIANHLDLDSDNDGILDSVESEGGSGRIDTDNDGIPNFLDLDSNNNGVFDVAEAGFVDNNNDGVIDSEFDENGYALILVLPQQSTIPIIDSDGDGIPDLVEMVGGSGNADADGDGIPNYLDIDSDNDGIEDRVESEGSAGRLDTDNDGIPNYLDLDSDNDGLADIVEAGGENIDIDGDGRVDNPVDVNKDGLDDKVAALPLTDDDFDGDIKQDRLDGDSDNDGVFDVIEAGFVDNNNDGMVDGDVDENGNTLNSAPAQSSTLAVNDSDGDGIPDRVEGSVDTDGDGIVNRLDIDSDNDGILDSVESDGGNGRLDTDNDGVPNHLDLDSDDNGTFDVIEAGFVDDNNDGVVDGDFDENGYTVTPVVSLQPSLVGTGSDGDGILDSVEAAGAPGNVDTDGDGIPNRFDIDSDNDGILDSVESNGGDDRLDTDNDGVPNYLDIDSDNDGLADIVEAGGEDVDGDGRVDNLLDNNADGIDDAVAAFPATDGDFDGDGVHDRLDIDSDNDGLPDLAEAAGYKEDENADGRVDEFVDANGNGLSDEYESEPILITDLDGDGFPNHLDLDSDNNGIFDVKEAGFTDDNNDGAVDGEFDKNGFALAVLDGLQNPIAAQALPNAKVFTGVEGHGCSVNPLQRGEETVDPTLTTFMGLSFLMMSWRALRRKRGKLAHKRSNRM